MISSCAWRARVVYIAKERVGSLGVGLRGEEVMEEVEVLLDE